MHHFRHKEMPELEKLWVIAVISNPARYRSRYDLFEKFKNHCAHQGVNLLVVELALGDRPFEVTSAYNPNDIQVRTCDELWHKENLINLGISRIPDKDWKYVAWVDADIEFMRHDWAVEIVHQLQHYHVIQLFQNCVDLGPRGEFLQTHNGFVWSWMTDQPWPSPGKYAGKHFHPGYCWAARREAINNLGGLLDIAILGAGDHHMACALIGKVLEYAPQDITPSYKRHLLAWQGRANKHIRQNIGYMEGTIFHRYHGRKIDRKYKDRWKILLKHNYDPDFDVQRDWQGVYSFSDEGVRLRNDIRQYFHERNEDSIDL